MHKLPRKRKKYFIAVYGANEYYYQKLLLSECRFAFMKWDSFNEPAKSKHKQFLKYEKRKKS